MLVWPGATSSPPFQYRAKIKTTRPSCSTPHHLALLGGSGGDHPQMLERCPSICRRCWCTGKIPTEKVLRLPPPPSPPPAKATANQQHDPDAAEESALRSTPEGAGRGSRFGRRLLSSTNISCTCVSSFAEVSTNIAPISSAYACAVEDSTSCRDEKIKRRKIERRKLKAKLKDEQIHGKKTEKNKDRGGKFKSSVRTGHPSTQQRKAHQRGRTKTTG